MTYVLVVAACGRIVLMGPYPGRLGGNRVLLHTYHPIPVHGHRLRPSFDSRVIDRPHSPQGCFSYRRWFALQRLLRKPRTQYHCRSLKGQLRSFPHLEWHWTLLQEQEAIYNLLVSLQSEVVREMKDGKTLRDVYQFALEYVREKKPDLEKHFVKNLGSGVRPRCPCPQVTQKLTESIDWY